jgi:hypothetical protein
MDVGVKMEESCPVCRSSARPQDIILCDRCDVGVGTNPSISMYAVDNFLR